MSLFHFEIIDTDGDLILRSTDLMFEDVRHSLASSWGVPVYVHGAGDYAGLDHDGYPVTVRVKVST